MLQPNIKLEKVDEFCILSGNLDRIPIIGSYLKGCTRVAEYRALIAMKGLTPEKGIDASILYVYALI